MKTSETFNKSIQLLGASLLGYFAIKLIADYFNLTNYWVDYPNKDNAKFAIDFILNTIPIALVWVFVGFDERNREAARMALFTYLGFSMFLLIYQIFDFTGFLGGWAYLIFMLNMVVSCGVYGYYRFENSSGLKFALVGLVLVGMSYAFSPYYFFDKLQDILRIFRLHDILGRMGEEFTPIYFLSRIFGLAIYIVNLVVIVYMTRYFENPQLWNWKFSKIELSNVKLDGLTFSIIFWSFRIFIISVITYQVASFYWIEESPWQLRILLGFFLRAGGIYVLLSIYRNFLVQETIKYGKAPSWQFLGLNIPIINLFVWLVSVSTVKNEDVRGELDAGAELKNKDNQKGVANSRSHFKRLHKNQGIKSLIIVLYIISIVYTFFMTANYGRINEEAMITMLLTSAITIAVVVWYLADHRAAHILIIITIAVVFLLQFFAPRELAELATLGSMVNLILYYALFHYDKMQIIGEENPATDEPKTFDSDDILDV